MASKEFITDALLTWAVFEKQKSGLDEWDSAPRGPLKSPYSLGVWHEHDDFLYTTAYETNAVFMQQRLDQLRAQPNSTQLALIHHHHHRIIALPIKPGGNTLQACGRL